MTEIETFQPKLVPGRLIPKGKSIEFRSSDDSVSLLLPIECSDLLILCDGSLSVSEIVRHVQKKNGTVHIQTLFKALYELGRRKALVEAPPWPPEVLNLLGFKSAWPLLIARRRLRKNIGPRNSAARGLAFYTVALFLLAFALLSLIAMKSAPGEWRFLRIEGSFFFGALFLVAISSVNLWFSEAVRLILTILSGGRIQEVRLLFNGVAVYPQSILSGGISIHPTQRLLLHISVLASSLSLMFFLIPIAEFSESVQQQLALIGIFITYVLADPYRTSEITRWLTESLPTEESLRIEFRDREQPLLRTLQTFPQLLRTSAMKAFLVFALIWTTSLIFLIYTLITTDYRLFEYSLLSEPVREKVASVLIFGGLIFFAVRVLNDAIELVNHLWSLTIKPWRLRRSQAPCEEKSPAEVIESLSRIPFFDVFNREELAIFAPHVSWEKPAPNGQVVCIGDEARDLLFLLNGRVRTSHRTSTSFETIQTEVVAPSLLSSSALTGDSVERQDIEAVGEIDLLRMSRDQFFKVLGEMRKETALEQLLEDLFIQHYFQLAPLMRNLEPESIRTLVHQSVRLDYATGETIFFEGTFADGFYLILRGAVMVSIEGHPVAEIHRGGFFGEISVIADIPRTGTVTALEQTKVLKVESDLFWQILAHNLSTAINIEQIAEIRLREDVHIAETLEFRPTK